MFYDYKMRDVALYFIWFTDFAAFLSLFTNYSMMKVFVH